MRVVINFLDHVEWSDEEVAKNTKKLKKFLNDNDFKFCIEDVIWSDGIVINDLTEDDFKMVYSFLTEKLHAPPKCIHLNYQSFCVNDEGRFELIQSGSTEIENIVRNILHKNTDFPIIDALGQCEFFSRRRRPSERMRCIYCYNDAIVTHHGDSLCAEHFKEYLEMEKEAEKRHRQTMKQIEKTNLETAKKQAEIDKKLSEIEEMQKTKPKPATEKKPATYIR